MFPIRCLIEAVDEERCPQCSTNGSLVISDSYAIVAGQTPLSQLVDTVLAALGLQHLGYGCKPMLQLKNWKPLAFDQITDEPDVEIESILKDVSNQLTLRILTKQPSIALQDRLLRTILQKVPNILSESQLSQWKEFLSQLAFTTSNPANLAQLNLSDLMLTKQPSCNSWLDDWSKKLIHHQGSASSALDNTDNYVSHQNANNDHARQTLQCRSDQQNAPAITRFSPLLEVPKLERWFRENANPSRQRLQQYVNVLNSSNFRKHTSKITYQQICNWFINARATSRKRVSRLGVPKGQRNSSPPTLAPLNNSTQQQNVANMNGTPWPNKVFTSQVRSLSLAFNNFIKSSSSPTTPTATVNHSEGINAISSQTQSITVDATVDCCNDSAINLTKDVEQNQGVKSESISSGSPNDQQDAIIDGPLKFNHAPRNGSLAEIVVNGNRLDESTCSSSSPLFVTPDVAASSMPDQNVTSPLSLAAGVSHHCLPINVEKHSPPRSSSIHQQQSSHAQGVSDAISPFHQQQQANRSRLMFDPLSELPMLEKWFEDNPHPSWVQIDQITETLNTMPYRHTYPRVSSHNVKIWFKNRRAKCKRHLIASDTIM